MSSEIRAGWLSGGAYAQRSLPGTKLFARLVENLQQRGFMENFLGVVYYVQASLARFDSTVPGLGFCEITRPLLTDFE